MHLMLICSNERLKEVLLLKHFSISLRISLIVLGQSEMNQDL